MPKDPYKYFRIEARELIEGLSRGVLELERGDIGPDHLARLLRLAHTLKGAARVVKQSAIAELAHAVEDVLTRHRMSEGPLPGAQATELLQRFDEISGLLQAIELTDPKAVKSPVSAPAEDAYERLRIDLREMDALLRAVGEATVQLGAVRRDLVAVDRLRVLTRLLSEQLVPRPADPGAGAPSALVRARALSEELGSELERFARGIASDVEGLEGGLGEVQDLAHRLRLIPAHTVFPLLERAVRDAAEAGGKPVDFEALGGEVHLDAPVLASLRDALMHVVRNAVVHGIEAESERVAAGKPLRGRVRLAVERRGGRVFFVCQDDGRGVDVEAVRTAAVARGLVTPTAARSLGVDEVLALLRAGGLTTSTRLTELSGRGIGLDVVRATALQLKGEFVLRSPPGRGATVEIQVPVSIASLQGLVLEVAGGAVVIPLDAVRQTLRLGPGDIAGASGGQSILYEGRMIPFMSLEQAIRSENTYVRRVRSWSAVVVHGGGREAAVGVDRLLGTTTVVMRALPGLLEADPVIAGATLDAEGNPQFVLEPGGLVAAAERGVELGRQPPPVPRAPVLVVDDSLTTRMLEQSILESAGYDVELAVSAEEGLAKARGHRYSLFVVDVEMPGMDGFGFVTEVRADPVLRDTPAILVTSRNAVEDRQRGEKVGAQAYIVKGEFDQGHLLKIIRRLVG